MGFKINLILFGLFGIAMVKAQSNMSAFCQRFPQNANCQSSSSSTSLRSTSSNSRLVDPQSVGLPPPPAGQGGSSQPSPQASNPCGDWGPVYQKFCTNGNIDAEHQTSCAQYAQACLSGGGGGGSGGQGGGMQGGGPGPVNPNAAGLPPPPSNGGFQPQPSNGGFQPQPQTQPQPQGGGLGATWNALTQKAYQDQQQSLINAQNGNPNCGEYQQNYNSWCGGAQQINPLYCSTLGRLCMQTMQQQASGQQTFGGPFANSGGLPTGGAGSTRPLTVGQNLGVGPFFGMDKTLAVNPLQGVGKRQGFNVPIAGIGVTSSSGVDYGGLPGVSQLGALLGGGLGRRRRRWAIPVAMDHFGNVIYMIH